ncbi:DUF2325 domain-containing protein [Caenispirillum salinarum]|uniref:DUF2325 domain-containing protein n=1 Tax=Caenispirillum salinarum TaxID=859058 RepID=UPI00384B824A
MTVLSRSPVLPEDFTPPPVPAAPQRRRRMDQIPGKWHCSIIGTCLPLAELRKIAVKARFNLPRDASDYRIHGAVVHHCAEHKVLSRLVTKALDKRFPAHIARFSRAATEDELADLWRSHCDGGDVPGAYWALMSHPVDCQTLREQAYGEVHMLSHLSGASQRVDMRRLADLERALASRAGEVEALTAERTRWRETETRLRHDVAALDLHRRRAEQLETRVAELESGRALAEMRAALEAARAEANERALGIARRDERIAALEEELTGLRADTARLRSRAADLELKLCEAAGCPRLGGAADAAPPLDLCRRRILYVGGMTRAVAHMRDLVIRHNGEFLHHDGGLEDGCARLASALSQADAVLCPVTCVSHNAIDTIKRDCRRACKAFLPLPSHSVSALERALRVVGRQQPSPAKA